MWCKDLKNNLPMYLPSQFAWKILFISWVKFFLFHLVWMNVDLESVTTRFMRFCLDSKDRDSWSVGLTNKRFVSTNALQIWIGPSLCIQHCNCNIHMSSIFQQDSIIADKTFGKVARFQPRWWLGIWGMHKYVASFIPDTQNINIRQPSLPGQGSGEGNVLIFQMYRVVFFPRTWRIYLQFSWRREYLSSIFTNTYALCVRQQTIWALVSPLWPLLNKTLCNSMI